MIRLEEIETKARTNLPLEDGTVVTPVAREYMSDIQPRRALYESTAAPVQLKIERPILCDCGRRAGNIGRALTYHCAGCRTIIEVSPGIGRVLYTEQQYAESNDATALNLERIEVETRRSSLLEPLSPVEY